MGDLVQHDCMLIGTIQHKGENPWGPRTRYIRKKRYKFFKQLDKLNNL